jgi:hypothetical protein
MKNAYKVFGIIMMILFIALLAGCENLIGDLPVSTVVYDPGDDEFIQYYTNDSQHYNDSYWALEENANDDPNTYEIECKKMSGNIEFGYGMAFGADADNPYNYYMVLISADGWYSVQKSKGDQNDSVETRILEWEKSDKIVTGYDKLNTIKVTKSASTYTVYLNNAQVYQFADTDNFGNSIGFYTAIGSETDESFPNSPVDVRFRQK